MSRDAPVGQRFSHVYLERGAPISDSARMRLRIYELVADYVSWDVLARVIRGGIGVQVDDFETRNFFEECRLEDFLDSITVVAHYISESERHVGPGMRHFTKRVGRIFKEENVRYYVDDEGGVHYALDEEFERIRVTALQGLGRPRYGAVRHEFEKAFAALDIMPPDTKAAARNAFESVEILFKLMAKDTKCQRLGKDEISTFLKPRVEKVYGTEPAAKQATILLLRSMAEWVAAVHFYRHGQAVEEPVPPPLEVCVVMLSQAATYLRWLIELDGRLSEIGGSSVPDASVR